jgi:hypothetical protein
MAESKQQQTIQVGTFVRYTPEMATRLALQPKHAKSMVGKVLSMTNPIEPFAGSPRVATVRFVLPKGSLTDVQVLTTNLRPVRVVWTWTVEDTEGVAE